MSVYSPFLDDTYLWLSGNLPFAHSLFQELVIREGFILFGMKKGESTIACNYRRDNMGFIFPLRRHLTGLRARRPKEQGGASLEDEQQNRIIC